jgi:para-nitrobenzyl esterase
MLAAGALKDRVKRIVMMSGVGSVLGFAHDHEESAHSLSVGRAHAQRFWDEAGISSFKELEGLDTADLLTRVAHVAEQRHILFEMDTLFYPRVDPDFCSSDPFLATNNGAAEGLDIIIGFTDYELGLWLTWDDELDRKSARWAANTMPFLPKNLRADLALLYQRAFSHTPDGVQGMHLLSDAMFGAPSLIFANSATKNGANCWMYRFDYPAADLRRGALHAADLLFFLGTWDTDGGRKLLGESGTDAVRDERRRLSESMQDCLINFARRGMPSSSNLPSWPQFSINRREFMQFDIQSRIASNPLGGRGDFWLHEVAGPILK